MTDQLPEHLSIFVAELDKAHSMANLDNRACPAKLRAILTAAQNMAEAEVVYKTCSGECGFCGELPSHHPELGCESYCPHRRLKEALNDD